VNFLLASCLNKISIFKFIAPNLPNELGMKSRVLILVFIFFSAKSFAEDSLLVHLQLDHLPEGGLMLNKGWRFQEGDNPDWASVQLNDSSWKRVDLLDYSTYFPKYGKSLVCWFRQKFYVDSTSGIRTAVISLWQLGASEVYLNGKLFLHLGNIHSHGGFSADNPHNKPFLMQFNEGDTVAIAIRFASLLPSRIGLLTQTKALPLSVSINGWNKALDLYESSMHEQRAALGFSFLAIGYGVLFFLLYIFFRDRSLYLLFAGYCFLLALMVGFEHQLAEGNQSVDSYSLVFFLVQLTEKTASVLVLLIISLVVFGRISLYQWAVIFYFLAFNPLLQYFLSTSSVAQGAEVLGRSLLAAELIRMAWFGLVKRNFFIGTISLLLGVFNLSFMISLLGSPGLQSLYGRYYILISFILISIYLIGTLKSTNRSPA
jgi:hypothetical protein